MDTKKEEMERGGESRLESRPFGGGRRYRAVTDRLRGTGYRLLSQWRGANKAITFGYWVSSSGAAPNLLVQEIAPDSIEVWAPLTRTNSMADLLTAIENLAE